MTPEQMKELKAGDVITNIKGNFHFSEGTDYVVKHDEHSHDEVIECDEGTLHYVHTLNHLRWEVKKKAVQGPPHDLTWDLSEYIEDGLRLFTLDHPGVKIKSRMDGKRILLTIKEEGE